MPPANPKPATDPSAQFANLSQEDLLKLINASGQIAAQQRGKQWQGVADMPKPAPVQVKHYDI